MAKGKTALKNKRKLSDQNRVYIIITLFVIAGIMLLVVLLSLFFAKGRAPGGDGTVTVGTGKPTESGAVSGTEPGTGKPSDTENGIGKETGSATESPTETAGTDTGTSGGKDKDEPMTVETVTKTEGEGDVSVVMIYPEIKTNVSSKYRESELNAEIVSYMDEQRRIMCGASPSDAYEYIIESTDIKYTNGTFFSAVVVGHYYMNASAHPTIFAYAINFDADECRVLQPSELFKDFSTVKKAFLDGKFTLKKGMDGLLTETSYEDMFTEYRPEYDIYPGAYYTEDGFGLIIELVFTLDGYALFEIPRASLGSAVIIP